MTAIATGAQMACAGEIAGYATEKENLMNSRTFWLTFATTSAVAAAEAAVMSASANLTQEQKQALGALIIAGNQVEAAFASGLR